MSRSYFIKSCLAGTVPTVIASCLGWDLGDCVMVFASGVVTYYVLSKVFE